MTAIMSSLRSVPIYGPGGGGAALGDERRPTYSVSVSEETAAEAKRIFKEAAAAKRHRPLTASSSTLDGDTTFTSAREESKSGSLSRRS